MKNVKGGPITDGAENVKVDTSAASLAQLAQNEA
jgi:hypothetical protein